MKKILSSLLIVSSLAFAGLQLNAATVIELNSADANVTNTMLSPFIHTSMPATNTTGFLTHFNTAKNVAATAISNAWNYTITNWNEIINQGNENLKNSKIKALGTWIQNVGTYIAEKPASSIGYSLVGLVGGGLILFKATPCFCKKIHSLATTVSASNLQKNIEKTQATINKLDVEINELERKISNHERTSTLYTNNIAKSKSPSDDLSIIITALKANKEFAKQVKKAIGGTNVPTDQDYLAFAAYVYKAKATTLKAKTFAAYVNKSEATEKLAKLQAQVAAK